MTKRILRGDEAIAFGALAAGLKLAASYPGSPSTGVLEALIAQAPQPDLYLEWSSNERVALELGIGASIAGRRALVCVKNVGMNAIVDPLMTLTLTPVHGGLVILLGDDPGGYGSQNDQDTRPLAAMLEMPLLEPATPAEGFAMMQTAFEASERIQMPVIVRVTRSFTQWTEKLDIPDPLFPRTQPDLGLLRVPWRFVPIPRNVVEKHRALHERWAAACRWVADLPFCSIEGRGRLGVVAAGFVHRKLLDLLGDGNDDSGGAGADATRPDLLRLKLGVVHPLPEEIVADFLAQCDEVLILEENEPFLEVQIRALAQSRDLRPRILGKQTGHVPREGELFRWQIQQALERFFPGFVAARPYRQEDEASERPGREPFCGGCRYDVVVDTLQQTAAALGQELVLVGDPGCVVTVADRLHAKYALGSAVAVADGLSKAGIAGRAVALFGDSSFFHSMLPGICNAVANRSDILMIVLDNNATVTTGFQPNPGVGRDALGRPAPVLSIERIAAACGVEFIRTITRNEPGPIPGLDALFREALAYRGLAMLVVRMPCGKSGSAG
jgi:indolepyruvate ferredoxin oxidoreductase alpha subunit